jgi:hypothetical protein
VACASDDDYAHGESLNRILNIVASGVDGVADWCFLTVLELNFYTFRRITQYLLRIAHT